MFENIGTFFKRMIKSEPKQLTSKDAAKERLHLVLMQDRANVSVDFLELMKQEIIDVIKKYIEIDEKSIDVRLTNQENSDGTTGAPALYANIPIINIKNEMKAEKLKEEKSKTDGENQEGSENIKDQISIEEVIDEKEEIDDVPTFDELLKQSEEDEENKEENKDDEKKEEENKKQDEEDKSEVVDVEAEIVIQTENKKEETNNNSDNDHSGKKKNKSKNHN